MKKRIVIYCGKDRFFSTMAVDNFEYLFGNWKLGKQLGSGSEGKVYLLRNEQGNEKSVVKILKLPHKKILDTAYEKKDSAFSYSDGEYCAAFIKNITDNIELVQTYDGGNFFSDYCEWEIRPSADGSYDLLLIRMELLKPLSGFIGDYTFTLEEVLRLSACLCGSLDKCRDFGFIYPNLKPENVMFDSLGRCKVGDLGTFCCLPPAKNSIAYKRTQLYMAPEFYKTGEINDTCDTYSLGLVMYALLNKGRIPFLAPYPAEITMSELSSALQRRISGEEIPAPRFADEQTAAVVLKAISYNKEDRYRTPRHMMSAIRRILNGTPADDDYSEEDEPDYKKPDFQEIEQAVQPLEETVEQPVTEAENSVYSFYKSEYGEIPVHTQPKAYTSSDSDVRAHQNSSRNTGNKIHHNRTGHTNKNKSSLSGIQKKVLLLLIIALAALVITVIVLAIKFAGAQTGDITDLIIRPVMPEFSQNYQAFKEVIFSGC